MRTGTARWVAISVGLSLAAFVAVAWTRNRDRLATARASMRTSSAPGVRWYEAVFDRLLGGLHDRVADEVAGALAVAMRESGPATPRVLEVGPGPGGLALRLAARVSGLDLTGVDIDPAMVARARERAAAAGLDDRLDFVVGDVADLPFTDAAFDIVTSTFSVHHWPDPAAGFAEILRVLRPGGRALIYDLPDAWGHLETRAAGLGVVAAGAFPEASVATIRWPGRVPLVRRLTATRPIERAHP
jgi:ubiquinone/menaquinone biosynthesis C-methylase UbiE